MRHRNRFSLKFWLCGMIIGAQIVHAQDFEIPKDEVPRQFADPQGGAALVQTSDFIRAVTAREQYKVDGSGLTVAVLDTGINRSHTDFENKIVVERNYTTDNGGNANDASDGHGHGTNVGGIVVAEGDHTGIAPGARIIPIKVLSDSGSGSWDSLIKGLTWVRDNRQSYGINAVNLSISDGGNFQQSNLQGERKQIEDLIVQLRGSRVAVVVAAGNDFFKHGSAPGMGFPAICRGTISTGAVYDANVGPFAYLSGAKAATTDAGRVTPFSQRLHSTHNADFATDIFAPGAPLTSTGLQGAHGESVQHGTSQAAPVTTGVILLIQEYYHRVSGEFPEINDLESWIHSGVAMTDGDDEDDNVTNTGLQFHRLDAMQALSAADGHLRGRLFQSGATLKK